MKVVKKIAEKILSYCGKCGGCPIGKIMDAQVKTEGREISPSKEE